MSAPQRITDARVKELRERAAAGESDVSLADAFGISPAYVATLRTHRERRGAGGPETHLEDLPRSAAVRVRGGIRIPVDTAREIDRLLAHGLPHKTIAERVGVNRNTVNSRARSLATDGIQSEVTNLRREVVDLRRELVELQRVVLALGLAVKFQPAS